MLLLWLLLPLCTRAFQVEDATYTNPVIASNSPDPGVLRLPGDQGYVAVTTSNFALKSRGDPAFPLHHSLDLVSWRPMGHVFPAGEWPAWAEENMWAPDIQLVGGRYMVYFTGGNTVLWAIHRVHVGVAVSTSPWGPYTDPLGAPLVQEPGSLTGAIDPHYFRDPDSGQQYLLWRTDNMWSMESEDRAIIYARRLMEDGTAFCQDSEAVVLLKGGWDGTGTEDWTAEAPWLVRRPDAYYLLFSTHAFDHAQYNVRVARSAALEQRFTKHPVPVIETDWRRWEEGRNCTFVGPGHPALVDGQWLVYHSWLYDQVDAGSESPGRQLLVDKVVWGEDGWPRVPTRHPSDTPQPRPAVQPTITLL